MGQAWLPTWVGLLLTLWFVHILSLCLALAGQKFEARRFAWWRRVAAIVTLVGVVAGVLWAGRAVESGKPLEMVEAFARSTPGWLLTLPTLPFARTICAEAGFEGYLYTIGAAEGMAPEDFAHARLILIWGSNTLTSNQHLWPFVQAARKEGARVIVIDPANTRTAQAADEWLPITVALVISTFAGMAVTALVLKTLTRKESAEGAES